MADFDEHRTTVSEHLEDLLKMVGTPADGGIAATGLYGLIADVTGRLSPFEKMRERAYGAVTVAIPGLTAIAAWAWWQYGDIITRAVKG